MDHSLRICPGRVRSRISTPRRTTRKSTRPRSRISTGPRTPSAKKRAVAARRRALLVDAVLAIPQHWLPRVHAAQEEAAAFCRAQPSLASLARDYLLLRFNNTWITLQISDFVDEFLASPAPHLYLNAHRNHLGLLLLAHRRLRARTSACTRVFFPAFFRFEAQSQSLQPPMARAASA